MKRIRLGVCIDDAEYSDRFSVCLANHYREQLEIHLFTEPEILWQSGGKLDAALLSGVERPPENKTVECPLFYLYDSEQETPDEEGEGGMYWVEKYQEVNKIVDEIMRHIGEEIRNVRQNGGIPVKTQIIAVYSLSENEYQLPLAVTLASILGDQERVLLLDLQENSGLSQLAQTDAGAGLEELLVMAESGKYSSSRMLSCIGHIDRTDYVYPADNTECLCEAQASTYQSLIRLLSRELGYGTVILNLGSRFVGFFEVLDECSEIFLLKGRGGLGQWRQKEFMTELEKHGMPQTEARIRELEIPMMTSPVISCERLIEQWKWNELGDSIRRMLPGVMSCG